MIEVTCNDRLGKKVRVKCKYPLLYPSKDVIIFLKSYLVWTHYAFAHIL